MDADLQPFAIRVLHKLLELMFGKVIRRPAKAIPNLNSDQAHADDMTELELYFNNLAPKCS